MEGLPPIFDQSTEILILGTFPSVKTREANKKNNREGYYLNSTNQFWKIIFKVLNDDVFLEEGKEDFLLNKHIGLWDVIKSCDFKQKNTSLDKDIINPTYNDFDFLRENCPQLKYIYFNGKKAEKYFNRYLKKEAKATVKEWISNCCRETLPSTSRANTRRGKEEKWKKSLERFSD